MYAPPIIVIIAIIKANKKEHFNTAIEIIISLARFSDGGAAMFAEIIINQLSIIGLCSAPMPLFIKMFRDPDLL